MWRCAKMGHATKLCPLNYKTVQDAEKVVIKV